MPVDIGGLDPLAVSLRDYLDRLGEEHASSHAREREAVNSSLDHHNRYIDSTIEHGVKAHEAEHAAVKLAFENYLRDLTTYRADHKDIHEKDRLAVITALEAVERLTNLHAKSHEREHAAHETVHQREREAAGLVRVELDARLKDLHEQRVSLKDQQSGFMPRTEITALLDRVNAILEQQSKAADNAHARIDATNTERFTTVQSQIDKLNIAAAAGSGASQRTVYLFGAGITFVTVIVGIIALYLGSQ